MTDDLYSMKVRRTTHVDIIPIGLVNSIFHEVNNILGNDLVEFDLNGLGELRYWCC